MTLKYLVDVIKNIALLQPNVRTATEGDIYDTLNGNANVKYSVFHITQNAHREQDNIDYYSFNFFYVDRLLNDYSNKLQIQSVGKELISNVLKTLDETFETETSNITFQPFTERFNDLCAGVYANVTISCVEDVSCGEQYGEFVKPIIQVINNQDITITENGIYFPQQGYSGFGKVKVEVEVDDYYNRGFEEGVAEQKSKIQPITITENGEYVNENGYSPINVNLDLESIYEEGVVNGREEQKSLLESVKITENGVYDNENGYDVVDVEIDTQSYYDEGYRQAEEDVVKDAQVLNITKNGTYKTKYSDVNVNEQYITGYYDDGTPFYNYCLCNGIAYDTQIEVSPTTTLEVWFKTENSNEGYDNAIVGSQNFGNLMSIFKLVDTQGTINADIYTNSVHYENVEIGKWYHLKMSYADGYWVNGKKIGDFPSNVKPPYYNLFINDYGYYGSPDDDNYFGMIKIDGQTIIPKEQGFYNITTDTYLPIHKQGEYIFTENIPPKLEGNLIKEVNVNVVPKVYVKDGLKFGYSNYVTIPDYFDFEGVTDMSYMFDNCNSLITPPNFDNIEIHSAYNMFFACRGLKNIILTFDSTYLTTTSQMFAHCNNLKEIQLFTTSNVTDMSYMFDYCNSLITIPPFDTRNVNTMYSMFTYNCQSLISLPPLNCIKVTPNNYPIYTYSWSPLPNLTDVGGFINMKSNWDNDNGLAQCPNLTYESCINILNGLYDFTGNGETPTSSQGKLKVHQNFITAVGDEISIATNKNWTITT